MSTTSQQPTEWAAIYRTPELAEYGGNPLIEALPPILEEDAALQLTANRILFDVAEKDAPRSVRLHCVRRLENLVIALPLHVLCECEISILIRRGYVPRNPCHPATWQAITSHATSRSASPIQLPEYYRPSSASMLLTGLSGIGKSTLLKIILRTYKQVIKHKRYQSVPFNLTQIVWLKIDCPSDGSLGGLCKAFFKAIDRIADTNYTQQWEHGRKSIPDMQAAMETIAETFFIGLLVIDELQNLSVAKAGGADKMMNFFVNMINNIGIPIIFTGTYKIKELFEREMRQARRVSDMGTIDFKRYDRGSELWNYFLESLWIYQWVQRPLPLDSNLRELLFDLSQGVTAILIGLFAMSQALAITEKYETVDAVVLQKTYDERMQLLHPALNALKSGEPVDLKLFEDLLPVNYNIFEDNIFQGSSGAVLEKLREAATRVPQSAPADFKSIGIPAATVVVPDEVRSRDIRPTLDEATTARLTKLGILSSDALDFGTKKE